MPSPRDLQRPSLRLVGESLPTSKRSGTRGATPLRLTDAGGPIRLGRPVPFDETAARLGIANEMRAAASLSALDARWIFAVQVSRELTGDRAAIITPESRDRLMSIGAGFGLRPFDTSLIIAIVQDAARSGEDELGCAVNERLRLVRPGSDLFSGTPVRWTSVLMRATIISAAAVALATLLVRWITG